MFPTCILVLYLYWFGMVQASCLKKIHLNFSKGMSQNFKYFKGPTEFEFGLLKSFFGGLLIYIFGLTFMPVDDIFKGR